MTHRQRRHRALIALALAATAITALAGTVGAQSPAAPTGLKATYVSSEPIGANPFLQLYELDVQSRQFFLVFLPGQLSGFEPGFRIRFGV